MPALRSRPDYPFFARNATETERIVELVRAINRRGVAVLLIEHVMRAVMSLSQRIVVINYGQRVAEGPPDAVARDPRVIEAYLGDAGEHAATAPAAPDARRAFLGR